jgi:parvulin-like peptidyl-prolyl isomerase
MEFKTAARKYRRIWLIGLVIVFCGAQMACKTSSKPKASPPFGFHSLKINGQFVEPEVFFKEQNIFYTRGHTNGEMLRKSSEERTDLMLGEIIDQMVTEEYLYHGSGIAIAPKEVDDYINRYIKAKCASAENFHAFMQNSGYKSDADLKKNIELHLLKLKFFSTKAKETGMTVSQSQLDSLYQKHIDENRKTVTRHIVVTDPDINKARRKAADVYSHLKNGADFGALAAKYSSDPDSRSAGGIQAPLSKAEVVAQVTDNVFKAKPGELMPPIKTRVGYEIVKVERFIDFCHPKPEFVDMILMEKFGKSEQFKTWVAGIKSTMSIEILDPAMRTYRLYLDGRYDQAGALYETAYNDRHEEFHLQRAIDSYRKAKNWTKMIKLSKVGIKNYPEKITYDIFRAEGLYRDGRKSDAMKLMKSAETRSQGSIYFKDAIVEMYDSLGLAQEAQRLRNSPSN